MALMTKDRVLGILEKSGSFTKNKKYNGIIRPRFVLKMTPENRTLLEGVKYFLKLNPPVREYYAGGRHYLILTITSIGELKNKIVPFCKDNLIGSKAEKLQNWLKQFRYLNNSKYTL